MREQREVDLTSSPFPVPVLCELLPALFALAAGLLLNEGSAIVIIANKPGVPSAGRWQRILLAPMMLVRRR